MPGSPVQQLRTREFVASIAAPAQRWLGVANSAPLKLYALLAGMEAMLWLEIGIAIGYFDDEAERMDAVRGEMERLTEMVARDVGGEDVFVRQMERFWPTSDRDVPLETLLPSVALHARFETMLLLESDLFRGSAMTLLANLAFADAPRWESLMGGREPDADHVVTALGGEAPDGLSRACADYFTTLDHIAAFEVASRTTATAARFAACSRLLAASCGGASIYATRSSPSASSR